MSTYCPFFELTLVNTYSIIAYYGHNTAPQTPLGHI